jgi:maltose O-acetyltransferase
MKHNFLLIYTWLIRSCLFFFPDIPFIMRFRGWLYSFGMKRCGKNFQVAHSVIINSLEGLSTGDNVYFAMNSIFYTYHNVDIGDNVMFGPACLLTSGNHSFSDDSYRYGPSIYDNIRIENGCWIAAHCVVLSGAFLPARSILAAGTVLTRNLAHRETDAIYAGHPAILIKKRK